MSFLDEIAEQGKVLRDLTEYYRSDGSDMLRLASRMLTPRTRSIVFTGMGTSEFVADSVRSYLGEKTTVPVVVWEAGELLHYGMDGIRDDDMIIAVSQSGESVETRKVVEKLERHRGVLSITNNPDSTMARLSRLNLPILAGPEESISNKTYTNTVAVLLLLSRALACDDLERVLGDLERIAAGMDEVFVSRRGEMEAAAAFLHDVDALYFVSRGPSMAAARQAALTYQEGVHVFASALPGGSMRHGPFENVGPGRGAIMFAPDGHGGDLVRNMAREMADLGTKVVLLTSQDVVSSPNLHMVLLSPGEPELFALVCAVPQELILHHMADDRGWTAGVFTRGGKITERE